MIWYKLDKEDGLDWIDSIDEPNQNIYSRGP